MRLDVSSTYEDVEKQRYNYFGSRYAYFYYGEVQTLFSTLEPLTRLCIVRCKISDLPNVLINHFYDPFTRILHDIVEFELHTYIQFVCKYVLISHNFDRLIRLPALWLMTMMDLNY